MKSNIFSNSFILLFSFILLMSFTVEAQQNDKPRPSPKASVFQEIGIDTDITIAFSRPGVKGRKIWGELVPFGLAPGNQYSKNNPYPWRGGANENTTIDFSKDVMVEGNKLPAGKYGLHFIPSEKEWTIIFSKNSTLWGSYQYTKEEDALRVTVKALKAPFQEWLTYGFDNLTDSSAIAFLHWEELKVPLKISVVK
ncbi:MAG: hypothetical protein CVV23_08240 [Ignavibacteriae bacterium HGW-Ignavibacteriae-2]|nr:MAG: hypothetical protein CVV23_08240 [Ignavibacteriae bacterium HGW-Ignavibacteriae-2]